MSESEGPGWCPDCILCDPTTCDSVWCGFVWETSVDSLWEASRPRCGWEHSDLPVCLRSYLHTFLSVCVCDSVQMCK